MPKKNTLERKTYSVRLRPEILSRLRHFAIDEHASMSDLLEEAIKDLLAKRGGFRLREEIQEDDCTPIPSFLRGSTDWDDR